MKAGAWGFTGPYAVVESSPRRIRGCIAPYGLADRQNLVFTLPAPSRLRADPAGHLSSSITTPFGERSQDCNNSRARLRDLGAARAPRGDALFNCYCCIPGEVPLRQREEVGLFGSTADPHASDGAMAGAQHDQTAFDGNKTPYEPLQLEHGEFCPRAGRLRHARVRPGQLTMAPSRSREDRGATRPRFARPITARSGTSAVTGESSSTRT